MVVEILNSVIVRFKMEYIAHICEIYRKNISHICIKAIDVDINNSFSYIQHGHFYST